LHRKGFFIQVGEYLVYDRWVFNAGDDFDGATAFTARFDIDLEHTSSPKQTLKHFCLKSPERLRPANGLEHWNGSFEYRAASQNFTANGRYVESRQNHRLQKWLLVAQSGRNVAAQRTPVLGQ
jgi:hypothetical protein